MQRLLDIQPPVTSNILREQLEEVVEAAEEVAIAEEEIIKTILEVDMIEVDMVIVVDMKEVDMTEVDMKEVDMVIVVDIEAAEEALENQIRTVSNSSNTVSNINRDLVEYTEVEEEDLTLVIKEKQRTNKKKNIENEEFKYLPTIYFVTH
jgi:hypothetical protein